MNNLFFEYPWVLWLELLLVPMAAWYVWKQVRRRRPYVAMSTTAPFSAASAGLARVLRHLPAVLRLIAVALLIVAIARPRSSSNVSRTDAEGIDIVLALDVSTSMLARDFNPDRIEAAKNIAIEFISQRPSDRIGVVVFAGESYTQSPLTTDRACLTIRQIPRHYSPVRHSSAKEASFLPVTVRLACIKPAANVQSEP